MNLFLLCASLLAASQDGAAVRDSSPLHDKAAFFERDLLDKHSLDGLYVSIVPASPPGSKTSHTVESPGNVIHAGVWTGRYLAGVGYQYSVTRDPRVRQHGGQILQALRVLQEVTGKPGLLARGYVRGHGPVAGWERNGADSVEWHQGQGDYADYRWYGDVSVDNFNAVLYGYAVYYDLAADEPQRQFIARDVDRLMTHLLDNHCRIIDVDGEVTRWGHVGIDPDREDHYDKLYSEQLRWAGSKSAAQAPLSASLMLLPDLLIAHHITGGSRYRDFYNRVVARYRNNPQPDRFGKREPLQRLAMVNHSSEGQQYEALYNLIRYERDPALLEIYRPWVRTLWEMNWQEGNSLFAFMTLALLPEYQPPPSPGARRAVSDAVANSAKGLELARRTLQLYPVDRVLRPVMNSRRSNIERNPHSRSGSPLAREPLPINERPLDNEYVWKGNPYQLDGWLKPIVTAVQFSCDDPQVAWICDSQSRLHMTLDGGGRWTEMSFGLMGEAIQNIAASPKRTFVLWAQSNQGVLISRDGGMSWRRSADGEAGKFSSVDFTKPQSLPSGTKFRVNSDGVLLVTAANGATERPASSSWPIPLVQSAFVSPWGIVASGPGGCYRSRDGESWEELKIWNEQETGAADFLHAYWMGRYYGFLDEGM